MEILRYVAFSADPSGGNPAGVVLDARGLEPAAMLKIAAEVGYSETAFLVAAEDPGRYRVRYFSPQAEVPFCGHATIAAAVALAERTGPGTVMFYTEAGPVPVETRRRPSGRYPDQRDADNRARAGGGCRRGAGGSAVARERA